MNFISFFSKSTFWNSSQQNQFQTALVQTSRSTESLSWFNLSNGRRLVNKVKNSIHRSHASLEKRITQADLSTLTITSSYQIPLSDQFKCLSNICLLIENLILLKITGTNPFIIDKYFLRYLLRVVVTWSLINIHFLTFENHKKTLVHYLQFLYLTRKILFRFCELSWRKKLRQSVNLTMEKKKRNIEMLSCWIFNKKNYRREEFSVARNSLSRVIVEAEQFSSKRNETFFQFFLFYQLENISRWNESWKCADRPKQTSTFEMQIWRKIEIFKYLFNKRFSIEKNQRNSIRFIEDKEWVNRC